MLTKFPLFQSHLDLAHHYWNEIVVAGDTVIDATCGNGHDSLILAKRALQENRGKLLCCDIQEIAIENTSKLLSEQLSTEQIRNVQFFHGSHIEFPETLKSNSVKLIVYNLGYLPGGDKTKTTMSEVTLQSIQKGMDLIISGGMISMTCYPGHAEGLREESLILELAVQADPKLWSCCHHRWLNRHKSPSLLLMQKGL